MHPAPCSGSVLPSAPRSLPPPHSGALWRPHRARGPCGRVSGNCSPAPRLLPLPCHLNPPQSRLLSSLPGGEHSHPPGFTAEQAALRPLSKTVPGARARPLFTGRLPGVRGGGVEPAGNASHPPQPNACAHPPRAVSKLKRPPTDVARYQAIGREDSSAGWGRLASEPMQVRDSRVLGAWVLPRTCARRDPALRGQRALRWPAGGVPGPRILLHRTLLGS